MDEAKEGHSAPRKPRRLAKLVAGDAGAGLPMKCKDCGWQWTYNGRHTVSTNCPDCYAKVRLPEKPEAGRGRPQAPFTGPTPEAALATTQGEPLVQKQ